MPPKLTFQTVPMVEIPLECRVQQQVAAKSIVLIVDDEAMIADTLATILSKNDILAMTAHDGQSALSLARLVPPDLLLTDVFMPDMSGIDLAIAIKQTIPYCKILLFSGQAETMDLLASARNSGHDFSIIAKPIHPAELLKRISEDLQSPSEKRSPNNDLKPPRPPASVVA